NDPLNGSFGNLPNGQPVAPKARSKYFYPGGSIGGPIIKNKMFFWYGMQYYKQDVDNGVYEADVPTAAMRNGDFTDTAYISALNGYGITPTPGGPNYTNGMINPGAIDSNGQILMNVYPLPNIDPRTVVNGQKLGWNYINAQTRFSNMLQEHARVDYNFSD